MEWKDIKDDVLAQINADALTEQFKQELHDKVVSEFLPFITDAGEKLAQALEESAKTETSSWCKIRDSFVLPTAIRMLVWVTKTILTIKKEN